MGKIRSTHQEAQSARVSSAYAIPAEVETVLCNWGRWAAGREGRASRHTNPQFTSATRGLRWSASVTASLLDVDAAWRAEQTICNPMFSPRFRTLLVEHYAHQRRMRDTCKLLFIAWAAYDAELFKAAMAFWDRYNRLTF